jgi:hypothetical protein
VPGGGLCASWVGGRVSGDPGESVDVEHLVYEGQGEQKDLPTVGLSSAGVLRADQAEGAGAERRVP